MPDFVARACRCRPSWTANGHTRLVGVDILDESAESASSDWLGTEVLQPDGRPLLAEENGRVRCGVSRDAVEDAGVGSRDRSAVRVGARRGFRQFGAYLTILGLARVDPGGDGQLVATVRLEGAAPLTMI